MNLKDKTEVAIENAERLNDYQNEQGRKKNSTERNPSTEVHEIVKLLIEDKNN